MAPEKVAEYFGRGTKMHMLFHFMLNQHLFLALARQRRDPLVQGLTLNPPIPDDGQWAVFLRNHDELDLGLAPMLGGDQDRIRMASSLMLTLPGTPVIRYGQEIGMGDDLSLPERAAVRTSMQWSDGRNGGFSPADPDELPRPALEGGPYGYEAVKVQAQTRDPDSLLNWWERAIRIRKESPEFGHGELTVLETSDPAVFAHACRTGEGTVLAAHNLADRDVTVRVDVSGLEGERLMELLGERDRRPLEPEVELELGRYGHCWMRVV